MLTVETMLTFVIVLLLMLASVCILGAIALIGRSIIRTLLGKTTPRAKRTSAQPILHGRE